MLIFLFALNTGRNYISSLSKPYNIMAFKNGVSPDHVNHELMKFANLKNINIVKSFNVPTTDNEPRTKFYVLGQSHVFAKYSLPRSSYASRSEFNTSDLRYPLYFLVLFQTWKFRKNLVN
ncbi:hypothetical protein OAL24_01620 [Oenococcus sicerae]|nr:hypothetical protein OAL24_01620 [Oenococcus sicerae]